MKRQFDLVAHLLLIAAVAVGMLAILRGRFAGGDQFLVIIAIVFFYLAWGLVYHYAKRDLTKKLYFEYLLIAAITSVAGILVFML
ncbi:hypothetical protein A2870_02365 [Candidatus Curtissbacteria bacterium RIFCSPHIGHO2_01_FULL_41_11]|uniref:Uncharacterized protein n=1 Tax=Candidatus Curtissbacteria bacterium RIFCSPHIGHO2_01_FULL_41_11 TaxID=1797711 RepID=A0A1F5G4M0_9BACT|nr:MAG: hypothetical protein A2870_02365 [Candidatus Curtissbacteria bacterium RIFCSPHIGHO2_01_FULL_41_11]